MANRALAANPISEVMPIRYRGRLRARRIRQSARGVMVTFARTEPFTVNLSARIRTLDAEPLAPEVRQRQPRARLRRQLRSLRARVALAQQQNGVAPRRHDPGGYQPLRVGLRSPRRDEEQIQVLRLLRCEAESLSRCDLSRTVSHRGATIPAGTSLCASACARHDETRNRSRFYACSVARPSHSRVEIACNSGGSPPFLRRKLLLSRGQKCTGDIRRPHQHQRSARESDQTATSATPRRQFLSCISQKLLLVVYPVHLSGCTAKISHSLSFDARTRTTEIRSGENSGHRPSARDWASPRSRPFDQLPASQGTVL